MSYNIMMLLPHHFLPPHKYFSLESYKLPKSLVTFPLCDSSIKQGEDSLDG